MRVLLTTMLLAAFTASAGFAQGWSGYYAGGTVGFNSGDHFFEGEGTYPSEGTTFGAFAGMNFQSGNIVYGGEIAYLGGDVFIPAEPSYRYVSFVDVKARVGMEFGSALIYGVAGFSGGLHENGNSFDTSFNTGYNYGIGVDYMISDRMFVGAEYLIRELKGEWDVGADFEGSDQSLQLRVGYKF